MRSIQAALIGIAIIMMVAGCDNKTTKPEEPELKGGIYVLNQADNKIAIYDWQTLDFVKDFDAHVELPHHMEMTRSHEFMFIVGRHAPGQIAKFDMETDDFLGLADNGPATLLPTSIAVSADGATGYVSDFSTNNGGAYKLNLNTMTFTGDSIKSSAARLTHDIKMSASGNFFVFCDFATDNVGIYDVLGDSILNIVDVGIPWTGEKKYGPYGVAIDNDSLVYIACRVSKEVRVLDISTMTIVDSIPIPIVDHSPSSVTDTTLHGPTLLQISPAGNRLYVSTYYGNSLVVVDLSSSPRSVIANIPVGALSFGIATNDNGSTVYVACANPNGSGNPGHVYVINAVTNVVQDSITAGHEPYMVHYHKPHTGHH